MRAGGSIREPARAVRADAADPWDGAPQERRELLQPLPPWAAVTLALALVGLLAIVTLASRQLPTGAPADVRAIAELDVDLPRAFGVAVLLLGALAAAFLVWVLWPNDDWEPPERARSPLATLAAGVFLLLAVVLLLRLEPLTTGEMGTTVQAPAPAAPTEGEPATTGSRWGLVVLTATVALAVLALGVGARRAARTATAPDGSDMARAADPVVTAPGVREHYRDTERDARSAVVACYATMESLLAARALPRPTTQAPREYLQAVRRRLDRDLDGAGELTALYELARYSDRPVGTPAAERARTALERVDRDLQAGG